MKTQIIQLEPHDDHISIRDKMNWSKTPRILLVFPRRKRFTLDILDLKLLQRHAHSLGAELGLVTKSIKVIRAADALDISTFPDNLAAQRSTWIEQRNKKVQRRQPRPDLRETRQNVRPQEAAWRKHPITRIVALIIAALALLSLLVAFIPSTHITLHPERSQQSITIPVRASSDVQDVFIAGSVPAHTLRVVLIEERSIPASGQIAVPSRGASGSVVFRNLTDQTIRIPKGTVVRSIEDASIRFETDFEAIVNAGVDEDIDVPVTALSFGESGNLDEDMLQAIEGELRFSLAVTNPEPTSGGRDQVVRVPTLQDREELRNQMLFALDTEPEPLIEKELDESDFLFPDTITEIEILEEVFSPPEGEPGDRLILEIEFAVEAEYATANDLKTLAQAALAASLPQGTIPEPNTLSYEPLGDFETDTLGVTTWQMRVEQDLLPEVSALQIVERVQGQTIEVAQKIIKEQFELQRTPNIEVYPSWWRWMPLTPFRVEVIVK